MRKRAGYRTSRGLDWSGGRRRNGREPKCGRECRTSTPVHQGETMESRETIGGTNLKKMRVIDYSEWSED
jgi:hypothetical protein